jgi:hypothetical protein
VPLNEKQRESLKWALDGLKDTASKDLIYRDYYNGVHELMIESERQKKIFGYLFAHFHMNLCLPVVDSLVDRLQISGFSEDGKEGVVQDAFDIWKRNRMARRAGQVHLEAVSVGNAYVLVWPNKNQEATFYPQKAHEMIVEYDPDEPGKITKAAKFFERKDKYRVNLYFEDRIEKYETDKKTKATIDEKQRKNQLTQKPEDFVRISDEDDPGWPIPNEYGRVPVFHFANNSDLGEMGISELRDAVDVQRAVNWLVFQTLAGVEFHAMPQRYVTGIEIDVDPITGKPKEEGLLSGYEKIWHMSEEASAGVLPSGDVTSLADLVDRGATWMALVTQTPVHYFQMTTNMVSGESQKTAEQKLDSKMLDRQIAFGDAWADAMALAMQMERGTRALDGLQLDTNWKDTKPRNEVEFWTNAQVKTMIGVSNRQVLREAGYTDEQIDKFEEEKQSEMTPEDAALVQAEGGIPEGEEFAESARIMSERMQARRNGGQGGATPTTPS